MRLSFYCLALQLQLVCLHGGDSLGFLFPPSQVDEGAAIDGMVWRTGSGLGAVGVAVAASGINGAVLGLDFSAAVPASLSWADGDKSPRVVHVPVLHDPAYTPFHGVRIALSSPTGGAVVDANLGSVDIPIIDSDPNPAGRLSVIAPDPSGAVTIRDDAGSLLVSISRSGGTAGAVGVSLGFLDLTATAGTDYALPGSVSLAWNDGESGIKSLSVPIIPRSPAAGPRQFCINAIDITGTISLGSDGLTVTILDHLPNLAGTLSCTANVTVREYAGPAKVAVERVGGTTGMVAVDWTISDGTAVNGVNYQGGAGTLSWADGDHEPKILTIPILADGVTSLPLSAWLSFSNPTGGLIVPQYTGCSLTILDGDGTAGVIGFSEEVLSVPGNAGLAILAVERSGGSAGAVSVDWSTRDGGAADGRQYTGGSGTLRWADGDTQVKTIVIPIAHQGDPGPPLAFYVALDRASPFFSVNRCPYCVRSMVTGYNSGHRNLKEFKGPFLEWGGEGDLVEGLASLHVQLNGIAGDSGQVAQEGGETVNI